jgi:hypothetical protein
MRHYVGRIVLVTAMVAGVAMARPAAQGQTQAQAPAPTPTEEKAFQDAVQRRADQIVRDRLAEREAARRLGDLDEQRKIEAEIMRVIPLDIEVVISRFQGDKKVSSLPYALVVNATRQAKQPVTVLRMGGRVPVPSSTVAMGTGPDGKPTSQQLKSFQYEEVVTQIDCSATPLDGGRFDVTVSVEDNGVATAAQDAGGGTTLPIFRSFRTKNNIVLANGQTRQFTVAADRLTGETVRVDVTLRVAR